ncbi:hypothetical protein INS49_015588 [Diaporthe citri]|uniref:uncharacterized protein n=1 Tax=Diaporthe citri TaxID=83186 RepID=UPI001C80A1DD|nr:uncharacterized protein INS49_015588 [Diaporthe citri]KAG6356201.1 hypothetical protein INS49_015588 [Diaporthe citri]
MVGSNIQVGRVLGLPEFFVRTGPREEVAKEPNYYEILNVSPLVDDETLRQLRRKHLLELHPDKVGDDSRALNTFLILREVFETLTDGVRRCEYDEVHRIKGKWSVQTCHDAFREEYRSKLWKQILEERSKRASAKEQGDKQESSDPEGEPTSPPLKAKPLKPKAGKPSGRRSDSHKASRPRSEDKRPTSPGTQAGPAVTVVTVEVEPEAKDAVETVTSAVAEVLLLSGL